MSGSAFVTKYEAGFGDRDIGALPTRRLRDELLAQPVSFEAYAQDCVAGLVDGNSSSALRWRHATAKANSDAQFSFGLRTAPHQRVAGLDRE
jgi:hypothetical protein